MLYVLLISAFLAPPRYKLLIATKRIYTAIQRLINFTLHFQRSRLFISPGRLNIIMPHQQTIGTVWRPCEDI